MSASDATTAGDARIWAVLDITDTEAQRWLTNFGRVVGGVPVVPLTECGWPAECEHCGRKRSDTYTAADSIGATPECRACFGQREQIAAIADDRDELGAIDVDVTRVVDR